MSGANSSSRVVILGAKGFVGSYLTAALRSAGVDVVPVSRKEVDLTSAECRAALSSLLTPSDKIVFVSALTPDRGRDAQTLLANVRMVCNVIPVLEEKGCRHLTYVSSDAVYTDSETHVDETTSCDPGSFHGIMHITREKLLLEMAGRKKIPLLRVRPCALYGKGDTHNSYGPNRFMKTAADQKKIVLSGRGEEVRDHLFIGDFTKLLCTLIEREVSGTMNAASGKAVSFDQAAQTVKEVLGAEVQIEYTPRQQPITYKQFDVSAIFRAIPDFVFTPLRDGLIASR